MGRKFRNVTKKDLSLCIDGVTTHIGKDRCIEGDRFARFLGIGGLVEIKEVSESKEIPLVDILNEPKITISNLDKSEAKTAMITEPIIKESNLDTPSVVQNILTEDSNTQVPRRRGRPTGSKNAVSA